MLLFCALNLQPGAIDSRIKISITLKPGLQILSVRKIKFLSKLFLGKGVAGCEVAGRGILRWDVQ
jgi:hypothetical protein